MHSRFSLAEYALRMRNTKLAMERSNIDVLLLCDPANIHYLCGYDGWSFYVPQYLIVSMDRETPIWIGRGMDAVGAAMTCYMRDSDIHGYPDDYVQSTDKHAIQFVADLLEANGWSNKSLGLELDSYYCTARSARVFESKLPNATMKDGTNIVNWVRVVKSEAELGYMREAAKITEQMINTVTDVLEPGVRQCDAIANAYYAQASGTADYGGDYSAICPFVLVGSDSASPHLTWTDKVIGKDEVAVMELSGVRHHYHAPLARTLYLGAPPEVLANVSSIVEEGLSRVLESARPGVTCQQLESVWKSHAARHNIVKDSRIGYSVGLGYPPDFGEHTLSLRPGDETLLMENMTIHVIPSLWLDGWGVEISETICVTSNGAEALANIPRGLMVKT